MGDDGYYEPEPDEEYGIGYGEIQRQRDDAAKANPTRAEVDAVEERLAHDRTVYLGCGLLAGGWVGMMVGAAIVRWFA